MSTPQTQTNQLPPVPTPTAIFSPRAASSKSIRNTSSNDIITPIEKVSGVHRGQIMPVHQRHQSASMISSATKSSASTKHVRHGRLTSLSLDNPSLAGVFTSTPASNDSTELSNSSGWTPQPSTTYRQTHTAPISPIVNSSTLRTSFSELPSFLTNANFLKRRSFQQLSRRYN